MEVGITVFDKKGKERQLIIEMPNGAYVPQAGDGLIFDNLFCVFEKRDFQVLTSEKSYAWSFIAREKKSAE